jgi:hypothetical protein
MVIFSAVDDNDDLSMIMMILLMMKASHSVYHSKLDPLSYTPLIPNPLIFRYLQLVYSLWAVERNWIVNMIVV